MALSDMQTAALTSVGLNLIQQALSIYDKDLTLAVCNRRFQEMFDLPDALVNPGASFADTIRYLAQRGDYGQVDDLDAFVAARVGQAQTFEPHYMERTRANGRTISVEGSPLPEGGWVTVYTDITRIKHQEALLYTRSEELSEKLLQHSEELAATNRELSSTIIALEEAKRQITEAEARTRMTAHMMPAHIAHIDADRCYTYSNRRLTRIMPGSQEDLIGHHIRDVLGPQTYAAITPYLDQAFAGQSAVFEFTHQPSSRRIRVALTPDTSSNGVYILSMDITEETQSRATLQQHRRREMAAQLTSGLAHDFSNLLTVILGMQSKLRRLDLPHEAQDLITATQNAAQRGGQLLNRIADITSPYTHHPTPTELTAFVGDFETLARSTLPDTITLEVNTLTNPQSYLLDAGMLQDALLNLVLNARDACEGSGTITLSVQEVRDTWLAFTVTDTGPGFSDAALAHAFEPFFTSKGGNGSGLGLTMVYDMAKLAGGQITLENGDTGGCVRLRLPLRRTEPISPHSQLVLVVEDDDELRAIIRDMLTTSGRNVIEATSATEALELLRELPEISLILSDVMLKGEMTGLDLLHATRDQNRPCQLMTSLPHDHALHISALDHGPVLHKPFSQHDLETALLTRARA